MCTLLSLYKFGIISRFHVTRDLKRKLIENSLIPEHSLLGNLRKWNKKSVITDFKYYY